MKYRLPVFLITFTLLSCNDAVDRKENATTKVNNTTIAYHQYGHGDTTLLFIHGWCINKEYWEHQVKHFSEKYKVVALDLPGFGNSDKNRSEWTFENYAEDINEFIKTENLKNVILIGHSMSGDILLLMDTKYPGSIIGIIGVDNLHKPGVKHTPAETEGINSYFSQMDSSFSEEVEFFAKENLFSSSTDSVTRNRVIKDFKNNDSIIAVKVLRSLVDVSQKEQDMMQQLTHKLYLINVEVNATQIDSLRKYCKASADVTYINATSHYPMIEKPLEFNAALEKVIGMIGKE